jgi:hypothetical protein
MTERNLAHFLAMGVKHLGLILAWVNLVRLKLSMEGWPPSFFMDISPLIIYSLL